MSCKKDYKILDLLGKGGFAQVYRAETIRDGHEVAIKMIEIKLIIKNNLRSRVQKEFEIHSQLKHPSIVEVFTYFQDKEYVYLVMEICKGGPLQNYITRYGRVTEARARHFLEQIVNGLKYLHKHRIIHRDLTLANILMINEDDIKIADFGLATNMEFGSTHKTMCGTPNYMSPEVVTRDSQSPGSDVWSVGCMLYTLLVGKAPFDTREVRSTLNRVVHCEYQLPKYLSPQAADLISSMLRIKPQERIALDQILQHPFMTNEISNSRRQSLVNDSGIDSILSSCPSHNSLSNSDRRNISSQSELNSPVYPSKCRIARSQSLTNHVDSMSSRHRQSTSLSPRSRTNLSQKTAVTTNSNTEKNVSLCPISTDRLRPLRQSMKNSILSILEDGRVTLEMVKSYRGVELVMEVMVIDPSTNRIVIHQPNKRRGTPPLSDRPVEVDADSPVHTYSLDTLPDSKKKGYKYCSQFIELIKKQTPKVSLFTHRGKCTLMESGHDSHLILHQSNTKVEYSSQTGVTKIIECEESVVTSSDKSLHCLSDNHRELMEYAIQCHKYCKRVESLVEELSQQETPGIGSCFPVTMGSRQPPRERLYDKENQSNLLAGQINSALISQPNSLYSMRSAPSQYNSRAYPLPSNSNDSRRNTLSNIDFPTNNRSVTEESGQSNPIFVPDIGWARKLSEKRLQINFNDGTVLCVDYDEKGLGKMVYTNAAGVSTDFLSQNSTPPEVTKKLGCLGQVVRTLRKKS